MMYNIYKYELKRLLKSPLTYVFLLCFSGVALLSMLGTGGYFDGVSPSDKELVWLNSPESIAYLLQHFNKFFLFLLPAIIGMVIFKDYKSRMFHILYSFPVSKKDYLIGKFLSGFTIVALIILSAGVAMMIGELILGTDNPKIGPLNPLGYIIAIGVFVLPNMLIYGLLVFILVASFRNIYAGFIGVILLFLLQNITVNVFTGMPMLISITDPFGQMACEYETQYWNLAEFNRNQIPLTGVVLYNRLFWVGILVPLTFWFYRVFKLEHHVPKLWNKIAKQEKKSTELYNTSKPSYTIPLLSFNIKDHWKATCLLAIRQCKYMMRNWMFLILVVFALFALIFALGRVTNFEEMLLLPQTKLMMQIPLIFYTSIICLITFIFSGMLVHRSRMSHMDQLVDSTPLPSWSFLISNVMSLALMQFLLLIILMLSGVIMQLYNGYTHLEISLYLYQLFILTFPSLLIWSIASIFIHSLISNLYLGTFILLAGWVGRTNLHEIGIESKLFQFNSPPMIHYSDLNGYGHLISGHHIINGYWLIFSIIIILLTTLIWRRGYTFSIHERWQLSTHRMGLKTVSSLLASIMIFCSLAFVIHNGEKGEHPEIGNKELKAMQAQFNKYQFTPQPKIRNIALNANLYPELRSFTLDGEYLIVNDKNHPIDTLLIKTGFDEITSYKIDRTYSIVTENEDFKIRALLLDESLMPEDSLMLSFQMKNVENTMFERYSSILSNGTFLRTDILPRLGYNFVPIANSPEDSISHYINFYSNDADNINIQTSISTSSDQIAIAPGYLKKQWKSEDRNYFEYETQEPIKMAFAINSGRFIKAEDSYNGVNLEIYHHHNHDLNNQKMFDGLKKAIAYNTKHFSPYQHTEARIIEFPISEGTYATTMANSIPMSEIRFGVNVKEGTEKVDLSFYVPAHELTHQWWGNQVMPANALGATMRTESITEYITLQIYKEYYNREKALSFLKQQRERYLKGRSRDDQKEQPLSHVSPNQTYIAYGKGTMAFNTLSHFIGEGELNKILKQFLEKNQFATNRFPTSLDLIVLLKQSISEKYHYLITDMMEEIVFYDNSIESFVCDQKEESLYHTMVEVNFRKYDDTEDMSIDDFVEIAFYNISDELIRIERVKVKETTKNLSFDLKEKAVKVVLDPNYLMIDKDMKDNVINI